MVTLTSESEWNPYDESFHQAEQECLQPTPKFLKVQVQKMDLFLDPDQLSQRWAIPKLVAQDTVKATTQNFIRSAIHPIE
jgi:hypothetical protein